ncbi:uncharacterized protein LOC124370548 [Homalodisca vitripennis]|uniref:uncharacterized protein LOC124370548 n=1 Tax=Homalodisca vitripennis TaxID=197043 RepID=UPI001EECA616|nr:uncharacterized protein LOC124370548 [Homalodisca vitripennis]
MRNVLCSTFLISLSEFGAILTSTGHKSLSAAKVVVRWKRINFTKRLPAMSYMQRDLIEIGLLTFTERLQRLVDVNSVIDYDSEFHHLIDKGPRGSAWYPFYKYTGLLYVLNGRNFSTCDAVYVAGGRPTYTNTHTTHTLAFLLLHTGDSYRWCSFMCRNNCDVCTCVLV